MRELKTPTTLRNTIRLEGKAAPWKMQIDVRDVIDSPMMHIFYGKLVINWKVDRNLFRLYQVTITSYFLRVVFSAQKNAMNQISHFSSKCFKILKFNALSIRGTSNEIVILYYFKARSNRAFFPPSSQLKHIARKNAEFKISNSFFPRSHIVYQYMPCSSQSIKILKIRRPTENDL